MKKDKFIIIMIILIAILLISDIVTIIIMFINKTYEEELKEIIIIDSSILAIIGSTLGAYLGAKLNKKNMLELEKEKEKQKNETKIKSLLKRLEILIKNSFKTKHNDKENIDEMHLKTGNILSTIPMEHFLPIEIKNELNTIFFELINYNINKEIQINIEKFVIYNEEILNIVDYGTIYSYIYDDYEKKGFENLKEKTLNKIVGEQKNIKIIENYANDENLKLTND